jgi:NAD(P)H dehydrogenase (quinone)
MTRTAVEALAAAGSDVVVSDLYAMGFDPVSDRRNFVTVSDPVRLHQQSEEEYASQHDGYSAELQAEMDKLAWCEALIFQFPLWWFGVPAILKGWVDRVFAVGRAYGRRRWFDGGVFAGKRAMCSVTVGGSSAVYSDRGINGPIASVLFPINHGILAFVGFTVIEPFIVFGPSRISHDERVAHLSRYRERVQALPSAPTLMVPKIADYDQELVVKARKR